MFVVYIFMAGLWPISGWPPNVREHRLVPRLARIESHLASAVEAQQEAVESLTKDDLTIRREGHTRGMTRSYGGTAMKQFREESKKVIEESLGVPIQVLVNLKRIMIIPNPTSPTSWYIKSPFPIAEQLI